MSKYYEIKEKETEDNLYRPLEIHREYVEDEASAEKLHKEKMGRRR